MAEIKYWEGFEKKPTNWIVYVQRGKGELTSLSIRGVMLMVITLGLYRFWFVSDLRRFFWSRTLVDDSPLEYTGRGLELFVGFLIAVAILLPLGLGLFGLSLVSPEIAIFGNIVYFVLLTFLGQYALFRARRYRLNRTVWRGLRLHLTGSAWKYAFKAAGWFILSIVTLGLAWPWASASLERFRVNHTWYGNLQFHSTAKWSDIIKPFLVIWVVLVMPVGVLALTSFATWAIFSHNVFTELGSWVMSGLSMFGGLALYATIAPIFGFLVYPWYKAVIMRTYFSHINAGSASLSADFSTGLIYRIWFKAVLMTIAVSIVLGILGTIVYTILSTILPVNIVIDPTYNALLGGIAYILWIAANYVITITIYDFGIWSNVGGSMVISNAGCIEEVQAGSKDSVGGINEGFADALDVGGGFEIGL